MILDQIVAHKRKELESLKQADPVAALKERIEILEDPRPFPQALAKPKDISLIAEIKKASPSAGLIRRDVDPVKIGKLYEDLGAAAISVLTDQHFFQGTLASMKEVKEAVGIPVLRKDFIIDPYQIYEARAAGADAVLLIVAALDDGDLHAFYNLADELGMAALVEVHDEAELARALVLKPRIVGVNNRDLHTFEVNLETTVRLRSSTPDDVVLVAESGIHTRADVERLAAIGADAMLVGESLVRAPNVENQIRQLLGTMRVLGTTRVKICGITNLNDARCAAQAGADFLGFIFYPKSPRYVTPEQVAPITQTLRAEFGAESPRFVGVFVSESVEFVQNVLETVGLDLAQLHGHEMPAEVQRLQSCAFKAIRPQTHQEALDAVDAYRASFSQDEALPQMLVDAYHPNHYGGTGHLADLEMAQSVARRCRLMLAGGLAPENVGSAIEQVRPWAVDVSSGVERAKGFKDHVRVRAFIEAARGAS